MPLCINCGKKEVDEGVWFCPDCSQRLEKGITPEERQKHIQELTASTRQRYSWFIRHCPYCHAVVSEGTWVCPKCGHPLAVGRAVEGKSKKNLAGIIVACTIAIIVVIVLVKPPSLPTPTPSPSNEINSHTGEYGNYYLGLVYLPGGYVAAGDGCYDDTGNCTVLINNKNAVNPSYSQLVSFLQQDKTDEFPYIKTIGLSGIQWGTAESHVDLKRIQNIIDGTAQPSNPDMCCDFAERLHNDAEMAGIRCAYVSVTFAGHIIGHACDAFQTTDRGLIYIDDTGSPADEPHPVRAASTVSIVVGQSYTPVSLFPEAGYSYESMGTVADFLVTWDGSWSN